MESDFGADLNDDDDWVQSYADYATQEDTYGDYGDEYGASFDEHQKEPTRESLEDLLVSEKIQNPPKRKSKSRKSMPTTTPSTTCDRSRKRKRTKHQSGVEIFLNEVLSWGLRDLLSDCRPTLRLPRLILPSLVYNNFSELTNIVQQVAIEETRVAIVRGCNEPEDVVLFDLYEEPASKKMNDTLIPIKFFVRRGGSELIKPGFHSTYQSFVRAINRMLCFLIVVALFVVWLCIRVCSGWIFCLFPHTAHSADTPTHRPHPHQHQHQHQHRRTSSSSASASSWQQTRSPTGPSLRRDLHTRIYGVDDKGGESRGVLTTLALGRHSFQSQASSVVTMWVHAESFFRNLPQHCQHADFIPTQWVGYAVENIITHQRVASISYDTPKFPFLSKLLGQKEASHIVFDSESEEEEGGSQCEHKSDADAIGENRNTLIKEDLLTEDSDDSDSSDAESLSAEDMLASRVDSSSLDLSQRLAVTSTLNQIDRGYSLSLVQGPPGCGKTFFLVHLLSILVHHKRKRVLVSAPSNKAISVIVAQYSKMRFTAWKDDMIVSIGVEEKFDKCKDGVRESVSSQEVQFEACELQLLDLWASNDCQHSVHSEGGSEHATPRLQHLQPTVRPRSNPRVLPQALLTASVSAALATVTNPDNVLDVLVYKYASRVATAINYLGISFAACEKFHQSRSCTPSSCRQCVSSVLKAVLNALAGEYADMIATFQSVISDFFKATVEIVDGQRILKTSAEKVHANIFESLKQLSCAFDAAWGCSSTVQAASVQHCAGEVVSQLKLLHLIFDSSENSDYIADELLSKAQVVCCTLSTAGCGLMKRKSDTFDVLLVDEAGQCLEGELLIPCFLNPSSLVLIGDPQQLPATVLSMEIQEKQLGLSSMQRLMTSSPQHQKQSGYQLLSTQYRMHPSICSFPNKQFYQGQLQTASSVLNRPSILSDHWLSSYPAVFINVAAPENSGSLRSKSRYNIAEAELTAKIVLDLEKHLHTHPVQKVLDIGIITFSSAQVKTIKLQLQKHGVRVDGSNNAPFRVKVMSVDGFQGSEAEIIILSFVRSNHKKSVGFLKDFQRLNVALTRAKHHLVMIGDTDTLQQSDCNDLQNLIVEMKGRSVVVDQEHAFRHEAHHSS